MRKGTMLPVMGMLLLASTACDESSSAVDSLAPAGTPEGVVLSQGRFDAVAGDTSRLAAYRVDSRGRRHQIQNLVWTSNDSSVAVVDDGLLYVVAPGETTVSAAVNGKPVTASVRSSGAATISSIDIFPDSFQVEVGGTGQLRLMLSYSSDKNLENRLGASWSSLTPGIATVSSEGVVTGVKAGNARIVARRSRLADTVDVIVGAVATPVVRLTIAPDTAEVEVSKTTSFAAALSTGETTVTGVTWSVSNSTVASVSSAGVVTGKAVGTAVVRAVREGQHDSATVVVKAAPVVTPPPSEEEPIVPPPPADGSSIARAPELPRVFLDTRMPAMSGRVLSVSNGEQLQQAIDDASAGDVIAVQPGGSYVGPFTLRKKASPGWIVIRSAASDDALPREGERAGPAFASAMPKLVTPGSNQSVFVTERGASHYRLVGLEITAPTSVSGINALVRLHADGASSVADIPSNIIIDRSYVHGHANMQLLRCVMMNAASSAVIDSYLADCHAKGSDSQAIVAWQTPGPLKIVNNFLEGAGENVMFGGADVGITGVLPSDIEIRRNHFYKPLAWKTSGQWTVKNSFEIKFAQRVLVEGNVFENNWPDAQTGFAILFKADNQSSNPWVRTQDITFRYNIVQNVTSGVNISAMGPEVASRIRIIHNVIYNVGPRDLGGTGRSMQFLGGIKDVNIENNTVLFAADPIANSAVMLDGTGALNLSIRNNVFAHGAYGVKRGGTAAGTASLGAYASVYEFPGNAMVAGGSASAYPSGTAFYSTISSLGYISPQTGDFRLSSTSPLRMASSATTSLGVDGERVAVATAGVVR